MSGFGTWVDLRVVVACGRHTGVDKIGPVGNPVLVEAARNERVTPVARALPSTDHLFDHRSEAVRAVTQDSDGP